MKKVRPEKQPARRASATTRVRRSKEALHQALLDLIRRKPYEQITARDIAAEAGLGYATYFRHYGSKGELLEDIVSTELGQLLKVSIPFISAADTYKAALAFCTMIDTHRALWSALLADGAVDVLRRKFIELSISQRSRAVPNPRWLPMELGAILGVGVTLDTLRWWLAQPRTAKPEQVAEILDRLVIAPTVGGRRT